MATEPLTLKLWINDMTVRKVANLCGTQESTVRHWRRGYCLPRVEQMALIVKTTKGKLTYSEMIETFLKGKGN